MIPDVKLEITISEWQLSFFLCHGKVYFFTILVFPLSHVVSNFGEFGSLASFYFPRRVSFGVSDVTISDSGTPRGVEREETPSESTFWALSVPLTKIRSALCLPNLKACLGTPPTPPLSPNARIDSHLRRSRSPALVSHAEAAKALSFGHLVLPAALVLPTGHCAGGFLLQLRQMLHAAVHLRGQTDR